jgi:hypothetical protein
LVAHHISLSVQFSGPIFLKLMGKKMERKKLSEPWIFGINVARSIQ